MNIYRAYLRAYTTIWWNYRAVLETLMCQLRFPASFRAKDRKNCHGEPATEMIVVIIVASVTEVSTPTACICKALAAGNSMPCHVIVQADGSAVALRHGGRVETSKAPGVTFCPGKTSKNGFLQCAREPT